MIGEIITAFFLGLLTPLGAACVLPLIPAFLLYVSSQISSERLSKPLFFIGLLVTSGIILFMMVLGLAATLLKESLTAAIQAVSPIAFGLLMIVGLLLAINFDFTRIIPKAKTPTAKNPLLSAFLFGLFFGAVVIPCNPGFIIALLLTSTVSVSGFFESMLSFLAFGIGICAPILLISVLPSEIVKKGMRVVNENVRKINLAVGVFMFLVSLYYLVVVFAVLTPDGPVGKVLSFLFSWVGLIGFNIGG